MAGGVSGGAAAGAAAALLLLLLLLVRARKGVAKYGSQDLAALLQ